MHEGPQRVALLFERDGHRLSSTVVTQAQRDHTRRLLREPPRVTEDRKPQHQGAGGQAVVDEAVDSPARGLNRLGDDAPMPTGAEDENERGAHARSIWRG